MKPRTEPHRRAKLPPILDIDDFDDNGMPEMQAWSKPRWSSDGDGEEPGVSLDEWPTEYDD